MYKKLLPVLLFAFTISAKAQDSISVEKPVSVEKSIFGIQAGLLGIWVNNEVRLSNKFALRSELGLEYYIVTNDYTDENEAVFAPVISLEPKWYYNLEKRNKKGYNIKNNNASSFSLKFNYNPDWFLISGDDVKMVSQIAILPKWGIRRVYGKHFTFETGLGIGPVFYFGKYSKYLSKDSDVYVDAVVRIGYTF